MKYAQCEISTECDPGAKRPSEDVVGFGPLSVESSSGVCDPLSRGNPAACTGNVRGMLDISSDRVVRPQCEGLLYENCWDAGDGVKEPEQARAVTVIDRDRLTGVAWPAFVNCQNDNASTESRTIYPRRLVDRVFSNDPRRESGSVNDIYYYGPEEGPSCTSSSGEDVEQEVRVNENQKQAECLVVSELNHDVIIQEQDKDPVVSVIKQKVKDGNLPKWEEVASHPVGLKYYWNRFQSLVIKDNVLYHLNESVDGKSRNYQIVLPKSLVENVLKELHDSPTSGHLGISKTTERVKQRFFWFGMTTDVEKWCKSCDVCDATRISNRKPKSKLKPYQVRAPLERVGIDVMGPLPVSSGGNKYLLVVVDYFTKWVKAIPIENQEAETVAKAFITHFVSNFGVPRIIHSDQGTNFTSNVYVIRI